jgi:hypothetical protein
MAAIPELLETAQAAPAPSAPPLSSTPPPAVVPVSTLAPPPVRAPETVEADVEAHAVPLTPVSEPLFTLKVWQLGFAVIVVMAILLHFAGLI